MWSKRQLGGHPSVIFECTRHQDAIHPEYNTDTAQVASVELEAAAGAPHALSAAGRALLQEGIGAAQRQDWAAAVAALLGVTNQDSTKLELLQQVGSWALLSCLTSEGCLLYQVPCLGHHGTRFAHGVLL